MNAVIAYTTLIQSICRVTTVLVATGYFLLRKLKATIRALISRRFPFFNFAIPIDVHYPPGTLSLLQELYHSLLHTVGHIFFHLVLKLIPTATPEAALIPKNDLLELTLIKAALIPKNNLPK